MSHIMISEKPLGESSIRKDLEGLTVSKPIMETEVGDEEVARGGAVNCLSTSVGSKVAETGGEGFEGSSSKRWSRSVSEEGKKLMSIWGAGETRLDCFARELFWKRYNQKFIPDSVREKLKHIFLPDDIVELCLMRLPLTSLLSSHLVCKKWRDMVTAQRFLQLRRERSFQTPWLFLFAALEDGHSSGEIYGLDVDQDKWHRIEADLLKGRFMYSVASIHEKVFIIGGCSREGRCFRNHREILVFSPLTKSWSTIATMTYARSLPVVCASEVTSEFSIAQVQKKHEVGRFHRSRVGGQLNAYDDAHWLAVRRSMELISAGLDETESHRSGEQKLERVKRNNSKRFVIIAIDEPMFPGEIYDSATDTWSEIQRVPMGFGVASSGIICNGIFYAYSKNDKLSGYDIERGFWTVIQTSPIPLWIREFYPKLVSCNQRLFMLSVSWCDEGDGEIGTRDKAVRKLWELDLVNLTWTEVSVHPDAPVDWDATYVSDQNILMGVEMFTIFGHVLGFVSVSDISKKEVSWRPASRFERIQKLTQSCTNKNIALLHL